MKKDNTAELQKDHVHSGTTVEEGLPFKIGLVIATSLVCHFLARAPLHSMVPIVLILVLNFLILLILVIIFGQPYHFGQSSHFAHPTNY